MKKFKGKVVVLKDGQVVINGVPVRKGDRVDVTIRYDGEPTQPAYPLRGLPVRYVDPFHAAVDEKDWDALK